MRLQFPFIQAAGFHDLEDAQTLVKAGFPYIGLPKRLGFHKEDLPDEEARRVCKYISNNNCHPVLITYLQDSREILELAEYFACRIVQIHGEIEPVELRKLSGKIHIIKSLIIDTRADKNNNEAKKKLENEIRIYGNYCDAFITDSFDPESGASGATGKTHDWELSSFAVKISPKPVILAGGLKPDNLQKAMRIVRPAGVDVHSGIEAFSRRKDPDLAKNFVQIAKSNFHFKNY